MGSSFQGGSQQKNEWTRRGVLKALSTAGVGSAVFARALLALAAEQPGVTEEMIRQAEWIAGVAFTDSERRSMVDGINTTLSKFAKLREVALDNSVPPALVFDPAGGAGENGGVARRVAELRESGTALRPASPDDVAFAPVSQLASLLRTRQVSSVELTRLYLDRLQRYDPILHCVVTYAEELALKQAETADEEIAAGRHRGPLHGIPWGAKDVIAVPGYRTTWGAAAYKEQVRSERATVVGRLEEAGAVLLAKLSTGSLAAGDVWFGGRTRNPWNPNEGSGGSSAGSAAATAAGLIAFSIGTEGRGSIIGPCTRCGVTGLRPTYGRVSQYGTMARSWSLRKVGAIARSVEDCALVFAAIHGADGQDPSAVTRPFAWPAQCDVTSLRVGYTEALFEADRTRLAETEEEKAGLSEWQEFDRRTLEVLRGLGVKLVPIELPERYPVRATIELILDVESATAFDELARSERSGLLESRGLANRLRVGQLIPAVEYVRANRIRRLIMQEMQHLMSQVDVYVSPSWHDSPEGGYSIDLCNLTGHPAVVVPNGFRSAWAAGRPTSITFTGKLYGESELLAVAHAYQQATDFHLKRPPLPGL